MPNLFMYNNYQQYSPTLAEGLISASPTFPGLAYLSSAGNSAGSTVSSVSSASPSAGANYSLHNPRLRYYLSKSFDAEDDLEFCPDIPEYSSGSPTIKKFNPYTAPVFSPTAITEQPIANSLMPRVRTPLKKPIEIVNPHSKVRVGSPAVTK